ncbi:MAG: dehydrogenase [Streptosporangiales bacterium]|nr:dehydrogenase [Streptosporangiales bacterium]
MRIGLIGAGRIGASHAEVVGGHPDVDELVVTDTLPGRAEAAAARLEVPAHVRATERLDDAFAADAVLIAAPTDTHAELILRGVRAGVPVFCEKPVALDVGETLRVRDAVTAARAFVHIGFQRRFDAGYAAARDALATGALGELHRVHMLTCDPAPPPAAYVPTSGGVFRDMLIHDFDALRWVTGREVAEVIALGANRGAAFFRDAGDADTVALLLRLADDTLVTVQGSRYNGAGYDVRMELAGTADTRVVGLTTHSPLTSAEPGTDFPEGPPWPDFWARFAPAYRAEVAAFLAAVTGGAPSPCTVDEALEALYVAEAADRSRRECRPVRLEEVRK